MRFSSSTVSPTSLVLPPPLMMSELQANARTPSECRNSTVPSTVGAFSCVSVVFVTV